MPPSACVIVTLQSDSLIVVKGYDKGITWQGGRLVVLQQGCQIRPVSWYLDIRKVPRSHGKSCLKVVAFVMVGAGSIWNCKDTQRIRSTYLKPDGQLTGTL